MLILTRKLSQSIIIMHDIKVTVLGIDGDRVKIGIEAPKYIPVMRQELLERGSAQPTF